MPENDFARYLVNDNERLKRAGNILAERAMYVCREYDGLHRLMLAVSEWAQACAGEGGRDVMYGNVPESSPDQPLLGEEFKNYL